MRDRTMTLLRRALTTLCLREANRWNGCFRVLAAEMCRRLPAR